MAKRQYYSVVTLEPTLGAKWCLQFGDYDRSVVAEELDNMKEAHDWINKTRSKIIKTSAKQSDINDAVAKLNAELISPDLGYVPINPLAHVLLTDQGAATFVEHGEADFEDTGDGESGPMITGYPDYDRYICDSHDICIDWRGMHISLIETELPEYEVA